MGGLFETIRTGNTANRLPLSGPRAISRESLERRPRIPALNRARRPGFILPLFACASPKGDPYCLRSAFNSPDLIDAQVHAHMEVIEHYILGNLY
jgi:hypothetical protein